EVGFHPVTSTKRAGEDDLLGSFLEIGRVFQWHEDAFDLPEGAELLYTNEMVPHQAFRFGELAYGVQFHFEITEGTISRWCRESGSLGSVWNTSEERLLDQARVHLPAQQQAARECFRRFASLARSA
ncbi:MAG: type 1 glutamine amidotransferase, partial [Actinomycetota bacterium]